MPPPKAQAPLDMPAIQRKLDEYWRAILSEPIPERLLLTVLEAEAPVKLRRRPRPRKQRPTVH